VRRTRFQLLGLALRDPRGDRARNRLQVLGRATASLAARLELFVGLLGARSRQPALAGRAALAASSSRVRVSLR
jgi:hypothetical protein